MEEVIRQAYAKINLGLDVLRRREDGYHEVKMIMQSISLCDTLVLRCAAPADADVLSEAEHSFYKNCSRDGIWLHSDGDANPDVPMNESNLIYKAIHMLKEEFHIAQGVEAVLTKRIPVAAGMAGGSTDGAAAFCGMNELFSLGLSQAELCQRAVTLGADIPYCIMGGTALSEGIGEVLTPLPAMPDCYILIAKPPINVSTAFVYKNLNLQELSTHPDIDGMVEALRCKDLAGITSRLENVLETVTVPAYPVIAAIKEQMLQTGAEAVLMSGSGPTVFGIFTEERKAKQAEAVIRTAGLSEQVYVTKPLNQGTGN
jgi:4-diphosphocytidyl-2-C-methyl-D-erythritol kinase